MVGPNPVGSLQGPARGGRSCGCRLPCGQDSIKPQAAAAGLTGRAAAGGIELAKPAATRIQPGGEGVGVDLIVGAEEEVREAGI